MKTAFFLLLSAVTAASSEASRQLLNQQWYTNCASRNARIGRRRGDRFIGNKPLLGLDTFGRVQPVSYSSYDDDYDDIERPPRENQQQKQHVQSRQIKKRRQQQPWQKQKQTKTSSYVEARRWQAVEVRGRKPGDDRGGSLTSKLLWINAMIYGLQVFKPSVTQFGIKLSDKILNGQELYRLVTAMFLHGGLGHLATNSYSLNGVGPEVEGLFGQGRFLCTYVVSGITGNILSSYNSPNPSLGASGAVFGIVSSYLVFLQRNSHLLGSMGQSMSGSLVQTIALNLVMGSMNPMIDNWGHIGGALGGAAMSYIFGPRLFLVPQPVAVIVDGSKVSTTTNRFVVVDKPIYRLPRPIESIPEDIGKVWKHLQQRIHKQQLSRYAGNGSENSRSDENMPWRQPSKQRLPIRQQQQWKGVGGPTNRFQREQMKKQLNRKLYHQRMQS